MERILERDSLYDLLSAVGRVKIMDIPRQISEITREIVAHGTCTNSPVPEGGVWCNCYNSIPAGRCNSKCGGYSLKK